MTEELKQAFDEGWRMAAEWANRDDLVPDMDSPQYAEERDDRLRTLTQRPAAQAGQGVHDPNAKLIELADRIDHEQLWRLSGLAQMDLPQEKQDRALAGVMLRRYANLLGNDGWRIFPPRPGASFRASTLDKVVEMARRDESRRASLPTQPAAQATPPQQAAGEPVGEVAQLVPEILSLADEYAEAEAKAGGLTGCGGDVGQQHELDEDAAYIKGRLTDAVGKLAAIATHPAPGVPEIDYQALIHAAWGKHKYAQGTGGCIAFKRGAEWFRDIALAAAQAKGGEHG